jgi:regulator of sigma E protease
MSEGLSAVFWGVITFSMLVVIHEGGHFAAARLFGVKVHEFMVGLPGPALRLKGKKTTYGVTAIPLGGYVRIAGMEPGPEDPSLGPALAAVTRAGTMNSIELGDALGIEPADADRLLITLADWDALEAVEDDEYTYRSRFAAEDAADPDVLLDRARSVTYRALPTWKRVTMLSAGVVFNLLVAILVFTVVLSTFGYLKETGRIEVPKGDSAAAAAGLRTGDEIVRIDGKDAGEFAKIVTLIGSRDPGESVEIVFSRDGVESSVTAVLGKNPETGRAMLGVRPQVVESTPSVWEALLLSFSYIGMVFIAILGFFNPSTFQASISQSSSVIGASVIAADAARAGALSYAGLVAVLSLSLGVINILPIPPLDGGKIALELIERVMGRPLPRRLSLTLSAIGAVMLFSLIGYLMYADIVRLSIRS